MEMHADATLTLRSKTVPAEAVTRRLELEPDHSWEPGDSLARRRSPRMRRVDHGWALQFSAADAGTALSGLLARVEPGADAIGDLVAEGDIRAELVLLECDGAGDRGGVDAHVARLATALGSSLTSGGESAAGSARLCTWATTI
ncbi:MAG: DUF4279 domain-containing protein [Acidimicrobiia bacterium]|nr:DUF4279 domain-containing protein [Acidimicrobiia bacterium]